MLDDKCANNGIAVLSSFDKYTTFSYAGTTLTFRTCNGLERYTRINLWDNGYIEVMTKYSHSEELIEEYIDLIPILENLYIDPASFLHNIKNVEVKYAER
jgi:hypothetical protein